MCFNPRSREGATGIAPEDYPERYVSIRAPVRERQEKIKVKQKIICFNPRSREGATFMNIFTACDKMFQSALP